MLPIFTYPWALICLPLHNITSRLPILGPPAHLHPRHQPLLQQNALHQLLMLPTWTCPPLPAPEQHHVQATHLHPRPEPLLQQHTFHQLLMLPRRGLEPCKHPQPCQRVPLLRSQATLLGLEVLDPNKVVLYDEIAAALALVQASAAKGQGVAQMAR